MKRKAGSVLVSVLFCISCVAQSRVDDGLPTQQKKSDTQTEGAGAAAGTVGSVCSALSANPDLAPLQQACLFALGAEKTLPDFVCQESIARSVQNPRNVSTRTFGWIDTDVFRAEVRFVHRGGEQYEFYSHASINGASLKMPDNLSKADATAFFARNAGGMLVLGEFGSNLALPFNPQNQAQMKARGLQKKPAALLFDFEIPQEHSTYTWLAYKAMTHPGLSGTLALDPVTHEVQRLAFHATSVDPAFPINELSVETVYGMVDIKGAGSFLLPKSSTSIQCERLRDVCFRNVLEFHDCRKFGVATRLITQTDGHNEPADKP